MNCKVINLPAQKGSDTLVPAVPTGQTAGPAAAAKAQDPKRVLADDMTLKGSAWIQQQHRARQQPLHKASQANERHTGEGWHGFAQSCTPSASDRPLVSLSAAGGGIKRRQPHDPFEIPQDDKRPCLTTGTALAQQGVNRHGCSILIRAGRAEVRGVRMCAPHTCHDPLVCLCRGSPAGQG